MRGLSLAYKNPLDDRVVDTDDESLSQDLVFGAGFGGISDIEVSPYDGNMYVVSLGQGKIFKIIPQGQPAE